MATLLLSHSSTAATSIPLFPSLLIPPSLPLTVSHHSPTPPLSLSPACVHPTLFIILFIYFLLLFYLFFANLPPRFEPTSHVGEQATLKPPLATGESLFCHAFILASCECRPSHASGEPTGVQMTVLCSQTAMHNEAEVRYEVADAGRGGKHAVHPRSPTGFPARSCGLILAWERQLQKRINKTLLQQGISLCLEPLMITTHRRKPCFFFSSACEFQSAAAAKGKKKIQKMQIWLFKIPL